MSDKKYIARYTITYEELLDYEEVNTFNKSIEKEFTSKDQKTAFITAENLIEAIEEEVENCTDYTVIARLDTVTNKEVTIG